MARIALFTSEYPFGTGEQFVENEISIAADLGHEIVIWPLKAEGVSRELPPGVTVSLNLARLWNNRTFFPAAICALFSTHTWHEVRKSLLSKRLTSHSKLIAIKASQKTAIEHSFLRLEPELRHYDVLYSYWAGLVPIGFAALGAHWKFALRISRGHGSDIYKYALPEEFAPFRSESWQYLDRMYLVSEHGRDYVEAVSRIDRSKLGLARLGTQVRQLTSTTESTKNGINIVSIGNAVELKRLDLAISSCVKLAESLAPSSVTWTHVGSGPLEEELLQACRTAKSGTENFHYKMMGQVEHTEVLKLLTREHVSLLLSVSSSEGIPVSQMEAMERGIPVVSTEVGGVAELLSGTDSIGVHKNASADEIARAMEELLAQGAAGELSRKRIVEKYDLCKNITDFYQDFLQEASNLDR